MMLALTQDAATAIRDLISSAPIPESGGLRIAATPQDDGRSGLELALVEEPAEADEVVEAEEARLFLEPAAAAALDDKVLDVQTREEGQGVIFVIAPQG